MTSKDGLHQRNKHREDYDFPALCQCHPDLSQFVEKNKFGNLSIDFSNPHAVIALNTSLLKHFYGINYWNIPEGYLCPPIPGRADYIHQIKDLFDDSTSKITLLDIGVGANCIYPLIANKEYGWHVIGSEIDLNAIANAKLIVEKNNLTDHIEIRTQLNPYKIFEGVVTNLDKISVCISNPPFHKSAKDAQLASQKKNHNLKIKKDNLNFGGQSNELWCSGGELSFITQMIKESLQYKTQIKWFTSLVSKAETLPLLIKILKAERVSNYRIIDLVHGNKKSRILTWSFS